MAKVKTTDKPAYAPVTINPPEFLPDDDRPVEERVVDQQWRDAAANELGQLHPLALNLSTDYTD